MLFTDRLLEMVDLRVAGWSGVAGGVIVAMV
jgi:hypothetical protein